MDKLNGYLRKHTELLIKDVGIEAAASICGRSKATLGRYYSSHHEHADRFIPIDAVARLESAARHPHVSLALAELQGLEVTLERGSRNSRPGGVNSDVVALSQRFAMLMGEYSEAIEDGAISINEAKRMLAETSALQHVLMQMKLHLEEEAR